MDDDTQRALSIFYNLRKELNKTDDAVKLKQINQIIAVLESSFFSKIVGIHKSLNDLKRHRNLKPEDIQVDENCMITVSKSDLGESKDFTNNSQPQPLKQKLIPTSADDFKRRVQQLCGSREMVHIQINKSSPNQTIGLSVKCSGTKQSNGIFVEDVTPGSLAARHGISVSDQIVAVDGIPLDDPESNRDVAVQALKGNHLRIDLYLAKGKSNNQLSPNVGHTRNRSDVDYIRELNTEWTQYEVIDLNSYSGSFGFGIMGGAPSGVMVRTILSGGAADMDGRLQITDHIMYINDRPVKNLSLVEVAERLKENSDHVRLIVARPFDQNQNVGNSSSKIQMVETSELDARLEMIVSQLYTNKQPTNPVQNYSSLQKQSSILNSDNDDVEMNCKERKLCNDFASDVFEIKHIEFVRSQSTVGLSVVVIRSETLNGPFVRKILHGSVAHRSGLRKFDRILKINGTPIGPDKTEEQICDMITERNSVHIEIQRYTNGPSFNLLQNSAFFTDSPIRAQRGGHQETHSLQKGFSENSELSDVDNTFENPYPKPMSPEEKRKLIKKWKRKVGQDREIIIAEFSKFSEDGGLGISLEGTVDVDESGYDVHPHHYIRCIVQNGPAGRNGFLREKDELLEANGHRIYGLNHLDAVNVLKQLPISVRIVCARQRLVTDDAVTSDSISLEAERLCQDLDDIIAMETIGNSLYSFKAKSEDNLDDWPSDERQLSDSAARSRSLNQVQGLAIWDRTITYIDLEKRSNGLGFSVLDYQDPVNPQQSVIVIRSLVPNGAAAKDGRVFPGDRLMSVNNTDVSNVSMLEAVDALRKTPKGIVRLGIVKALCLDPNNSHLNSNTSDSMSPNHLDTVLSPTLVEDIENDVNLEEFYIAPIPEDLEHKVIVRKLAGQKLGMQLESEGTFSNNENGFVIKSIDHNSPVDKCGQLSVGDFVTKIGNNSIRGENEIEVDSILRRITFDSGDVRINFIPESDYRIFIHSKTMQANYK